MVSQFLYVKAMKNVLFIMHSMPIGGAEKVLIDIFAHFDYTHYNVELLLYTYEGELLSQIDNHVKIKGVFQPHKRTLYWRILGRLKKILHLEDWLERQRTRKLISLQYDCIVSFCQGPAHKLHTYLLDKASKHISWVHSDLMISNWGKLFFHNSLKQQEAAYNLMTDIIFVSEGAKEAFLRLFHIHDRVNKIVICNIVDVTCIRTHALDEQINKPAGKFLFINSGRLVEQKAQMRLVEAASLLKKTRSDFEIWIMGKGPLENELQTAINEKGVSEEVKLIGAKNNPYPYMMAADGFVLSSLVEGFPIVVCEALALGKPIISTKVTGSLELLQNSRYGILVDETASAIAEGLLRLMQEPDLMKHYADMALERAKMFDVDNTMSEIYKVIG